MATIFPDVARGVVWKRKKRVNFLSIDWEEENRRSLRGSCSRLRKKMELEQKQKLQNAVLEIVRDTDYHSRLEKISGTDAFVCLSLRTLITGPGENNGGENNQAAGPGENNGGENNQAAGPEENAPELLSSLLVKFSRNADKARVEALNKGELKALNHLTTDEDFLKEFRGELPSAVATDCSSNDNSPARSAKRPKKNETQRTENVLKGTMRSMGGAVEFEQANHSIPADIPEEENDGEDN